MFGAVNTILGNFLNRFLNYLPNFLGGIIILAIGIIIATILKKVLIALFTLFKLPLYLDQAKIMRAPEVHVWQDVFSEVLRWTVIVLFLIPTLEVFGLSRATVVINQLLLYLPNVIVAVIIGFVGIIAANLLSEIVKNSFKTVRPSLARSMALFTRGVIVFFTILIVLNQLGVAQDLIRILFTGIVAMVALAGGLAFGLGGQSVAKEILNELRKKLK